MLRFLRSLEKFEYVSGSKARMAASFLTTFLVALVGTVLAILGAGLLLHWILVLT